MLGLGHTLVAGSALQDSIYAMTKAFEFDGTNDGFITGVGEGVDPANGTIKPTTNSLSVAVWLRLDDGTDDPYENSGQYMAVSCTANGGWNVRYNNRKFYANFAIFHGNGTTSGAGAANSDFRAARNQEGSGNFTRYLHKADFWHLVIATSDMSNRATETVTKIYVDGSRDQAGNKSGSGSTNFGAERLYNSGSTNSSTVTLSNSSAASGSITRRYQTEQQGISLTIGGKPLVSSGSTGMHTNFWTGYIGDVAVWEDHVLTAAEIETLYNLHNPIDMSTVQNGKLVGYWRPTVGLNDSISSTTGSLVDDGAVVVNAPSTDVSGFFGYQ